MNFSYITILVVIFRGFFLLRNTFKDDSVPGFVVFAYKLSLKQTEAVEKVSV